MDSDVDLVAIFFIASGDVQDTAGIYDNVRSSMLQRCEAYLMVGVRSFEYFLCHVDLTKGLLHLFVPLTYYIPNFFTLQGFNAAFPDTPYTTDLFLFVPSNAF